VQLREALARGFTQYAYAFVQSDAEALPEGSPQRRAIEQRASRLYARARDYGVDGMHIRAGITAVDLRRPERATALARLQKEDVGLIYWTVASWGSQVALNKADMKIVGDLAAVDALFERALQLDEAYDKGALHELALSLLGGRAKPEALEEHFKRALDLSGGRRLSIFVSHAQAIAAPKNDKAGWKDDLEHVLHSNIDAPDAREDRLANVLAQRKARFLLEHVSDVFLDESN
jgi:hypothetical protein